MWERRGKPRAEAKASRLPAAERRKLTSDLYRKENRDLCAKRTEKHKIRTRLEVLAHYGAQCACCGEARYEFLTMDHMNNDGAKHRRETKIGASIYYWLKKNGYPSGFQILCMNCNWAKGRYGECPHERERRKDVGIYCEKRPWEQIAREAKRCGSN